MGCASWALIALFIGLGSQTIITEEALIMEVFITGGAGFIGSNLANHHLRRGDRVTILDNLSRRGSDCNLGRWSGSTAKTCASSAPISAITTPCATHSPRTPHASITWPARWPSPLQSAMPARISRSTRWGRSTSWRPCAASLPRPSCSTPLPTRSTAAWKPCARPRTKYAPPLYRLYRRHPGI